jgi:hypothetical protein
MNSRLTERGLEGDVRGSKSSTEAHGMTSNIDMKKQKDKRR